MTEYQKYLYYCLAEECAEVTKEVMKILRFGEEDWPPLDTSKVANIEKLKAEIIDLVAVMEMTVYIDPNRLDEPINQKKEKVKRYYEYSEGKKVESNMD